MNELLAQIIRSPELHARWLNTLSYLENCGARKIAACEHPTMVAEEMLKHASEEFRHAYHLKRQIIRIPSAPLVDYSLPHLLGGKKTLHYLHALDLKCCAFLTRNMGLPKERVREIAYLLVTYAIEMRADHLYPLYDSLLREMGSRVMVKVILLEEKEHLEEMRTQIGVIPRGWYYAKTVCALEETLYQKWLEAIEEAVRMVAPFSLPQ